MRAIPVEITYDFICPWCWIGHRHLMSALKETAPDVPVKFTYVPYELNPDMPKSGKNRKEYRSAKFGSWARSQAMDAEVMQAARKANAEFNYDRVQVTPNTRLAHQLMVFAKQKGEILQIDRLFDSIFAAYFSDGHDIGSLDVLVALAGSGGFDVREVRNYLAANAGERQVVGAELEAMTGGIRSVPTTRIGESVISGAQPVAVFREVILASKDLAA